MDEFPSLSFWLFIKLVSPSFHISLKESHLKVIKNDFNLPKMFFWFLRYSNFYNFPPPCPMFQDLKCVVENIIIMTSWNGLHKLEIMIFGITRKPLWIKASKMNSWGITKERKLLNIFGNQIGTGNYFEKSFRFRYNFHKKWVRKQKWSYIFQGFFVILLQRNLFPTEFLKALTSFLAI